jgi:hypothetical protein
MNSYFPEVGGHYSRVVLIFNGPEGCPCKNIVENFGTVHSRDVFRGSVTANDLRDSSDDYRNLAELRAAVLEAAVNWISGKSVVFMESVHYPDFAYYREKTDTPDTCWEVFYVVSTVLVKWNDSDPVPTERRREIHAGNLAHRQRFSSTISPFVADRASFRAVIIYPVNPAHKSPHYLPRDCCCHVVGVTTQADYDLMVVMPFFNYMLHCDFPFDPPITGIRSPIFIDIVTGNKHDFRRFRESEYEAGLWVGDDAYGTADRRRSGIDVTHIIDRFSSPDTGPRMRQAFSRILEARCAHVALHVFCQHGHHRSVASGEGLGFLFWNYGMSVTVYHPRLRGTNYSVIFSSSNNRYLESLIGCEPRHSGLPKGRNSLCYSPWLNR